MENRTSFEKGKARPGLDRLTGGTYTRIPSIRVFQKKKRLLHYKLVEVPFLKRLKCTITT